MFGPHRKRSCWYDVDQRHIVQDIALILIFFSFWTYVIANNLLDVVATDQPAQGFKTAGSCPKEPPKEMLDAYTMGGKLGMCKRLVDNT